MAATTENRGAYRPAEAAAWLGVSRDTLDRLCQRKEISSWTVGRARFISAKELERFVAEREAEAR
ncbi:MAG: helix-turn-helix domain-containing protein [Dehalococcoidia bacterium]|nr:helix-turn-helix domain-containing protein [Dehalococcoidia bacterium]